MDTPLPPVEVKVWGDYGIFTMPELKVERVSYPMMTPSAARGVLESIFWKPQFLWRIEEIWMLAPPRFSSIAFSDNGEIAPGPRYFSTLRNEVNSRASERTAHGWEKNGGGFDAVADRSQRHTLALRDVAYLIRAHAVLQPGVMDDIAKYRDQFRRRVRRGRCFAMPYLGTRECTAFFTEPDGTERPVDYTADIGMMLDDLDYASDGSGRGTPRFWNARVEGGILRPPHAGSAEKG